MTDIIRIYSAYVTVLFYFGATNSFISSNFVKRHKLTSKLIDMEFYIKTPMGNSIVANQECRSCPLQLANRELYADLLILDMEDFDIILGMDWLLSYHAFID